MEVIPATSDFIALTGRFLHVCGGDPVKRTQRLSRRLVFSTYVEVILKDIARKLAGECFLHVCGGDPSNCLHVASGSLFSPRMWR